MKITRIEIPAFRNIEHLYLDIPSNIISFCGNNKLGKTNCLNALYWCLTGVTLDNTSGDEKNIPYGKDSAEVRIITDMGKFARSVNADHKQTLKIDDIEVKKNEFEERVYKKCNNLFNEFRFFLNPMYLAQVKESDFRKWFIKHLELDIESEFNKLDELKKSYLIELSQRKFNVEETSKSFADKKKTFKKNVDEWVIICDYLHRYQPSLKRDIEQAELMLSIHQKDLQDIETKIILLDEFVVELDKIYQEKTDVKLLEKGIGEDVWKEVCRPLVKGTSTYWFNGSTAEQKTTLCNFVASMGSTLPMFIDEAEIFDSDSLSNLKATVNNQIFCAKVVDGLTKIHVKVD